MRNIILLLSILLLPSCIADTDQLTFQNETDHWQVEYHVDIKGEDSESTRLFLKYVGEGEAPENINYRIDSVTGSNGGNNTLLKNGLLDISLGSCSGCSITREDEEIEITIEWNNDSETFMLNNNS
ncbi:hypothetical protein [Piscibacillus halophilus]|uniref:hypothetical protein n=1 Tax=Piscibacillus halophilus TaxID=571933 RepID=UPI0024090783|nr:hypothetical protein [Piscibacillus halophilus]